MGGSGSSTAVLVGMQHEIIRDLVSSLSVATKSFGESKGCQIDDIVYDALVWTGLHESTAWATLDEEFKDVYNNIINYEITGFEILAEGAPCD